MNFFNKLESVFYPTLKKILSIMRLTTLLLIVFSLNISATIYSQNTKLSLDVKNQSIKEVLFLIENQSDFRFIYESGKINLDKIYNRQNQKYNFVIRKVKISVNDQFISNLRQKHIAYSKNSIFT